MKKYKANIRWTYWVLGVRWNDVAVTFYFGPLMILRYRKGFGYER